MYSYIYIYIYIFVCLFTALTSWLGTCPTEMAIQGEQGVGMFSQSPSIERLCGVNFLSDTFV